MTLSFKNNPNQQDLGLFLQSWMKVGLWMLAGANCRMVVLVTCPLDVESVLPRFQLP
jgi:hypothetical protein